MYICIYIYIYILVGHAGLNLNSAWGYIWCSVGQSLLPSYAWLWVVFFGGFRVISIDIYIYMGFKGIVGF